MREAGNATKPGVLHPGNGTPTRVVRVERWDSHRSFHHSEPYTRPLPLRLVWTASGGSPEHSLIRPGDMQGSQTLAALATVGADTSLLPTQAPVLDPSSKLRPATDAVNGKLPSLGSG